MKFSSIILAAIIFCSSTNVLADDTRNPFGVLATLPNSYWTQPNGSIARLFWSLESEEISLESISFHEGLEGLYSAKFRRSVDNSRITVDYKWPDDLFQSTVRYRVELPSPDRYELFSEDGQKISSCRMSSNEKLLRCEHATATGEIKEFQHTRVTKQQYEALRTEALGKVQQIQIDRKTAAATRTMENNAREDALRKAWGALLNFIPLQNGVPVVVDRDFKAQWTWKNQVKPAAVRFSWRKNPEGIVGIFEEWSSPGSIEVGRFFWKPGPQPGQLIRKTYYSGKEAVFQIAPNGTLTGTGYGWVYGPSQQLVISDSSDGARMAQYKASDTARSSPYATYIFVEQVGAFDQARADYQRSKVQAKQSGSGIGGLLMGAALGGALTDGSAEGIIAGARALAPSDATRNQLDDIADDMAADRREAARNDAEFAARTQRTIRQNSPQPALSSTAPPMQTNPAARTANAGPPQISANVQSPKATAGGKYLRYHCFAQFFDTHSTGGPFEKADTYYSSKASGPILWDKDYTESKNLMGSRFRDYINSIGLPFAKLHHETGEHEPRNRIGCLAFGQNDTAVQQAVDDAETEWGKDGNKVVKVDWIPRF